MSQPRHFIEFGPSMRVLIEDAIESLILLLDEIDGDDGAEDEGDFENGHDAEPAADSEEDDAPEYDWCDLPADLGPPFTMDQSLQGAKIEASPPETFLRMRAGKALSKPGDIPSFNPS
jgi:hypothetical protein